MPCGKKELAEQIIPKLREVKVEVGRGKTVLEAVEQFVAEPAVEALHVAVSPGAGLLDGESANARPRQPLLNLLGNELQPVIAPQMLGRTPHGEQLLRVMSTSRAVNDLATSIARHSRVNASITTRIRSCLPFSVRSERSAKGVRLLADDQPSGTFAPFPRSPSACRSKPTI